MKSRINRNNYEEFFIDYLDGNLGEPEIIELENFLLQHPDLKEELEGLEDAIVSPKESAFSVKENLKQIDLDLPVTDSNFEFFCIAEAEGDLDKEKQEAFEFFLQENPEKYSERALYKKLKLLKNDIVIFQNKSLLKRSPFRIYRREIMTGLSVAAGIAILLGLFFIFLESEMQSPINLAESEEKIAVDSTASKKDLKEIQNNTENENIKQKLLKKPVIQSAKSKISFKVSIPVASNQIEHEQDITDNETATDTINYKEKLQNISINPSEMSSLLAFSSEINEDEIEIRSFTSGYQGLNFTEPQQFLTLEQYAKKKFSGFIFGDEEVEINAVNLASAGINRINQLTGSDMKLEAEEAEEGSGKKLAFNSRLISFSTVIAREDD